MLTLFKKFKIDFSLFQKKIFFIFRKKIEQDP